MTSIAPMLAQSIDNVERDIDKYINDDLYWFEQKLDGHRRTIQVTNGHAVATNRKGETIIEPQLTALFDHLEGDWCFDGEWIDNKFWIFDMPVALDMIVPSTPYETRRLALESVYERGWKDDDLIQLVEVHRTCEEKRALLDWCRANDAEGIMVKSTAGKYHPGKRSTAILKAKFTETADCIVGEVGRQGKSSISVFVYEEGHLQNIGSVTMSAKNLAKVKTGDVVEVKYLYLGAGSRLYQPRFVGFRDDKDPSECTADQLKFVNKEVRIQDRNDR